ncbi:transposase [Synechococcus sp. CBW1006]|uniref:transposase n=1 Tax=Synechococcus sp. CBW1006 TaxID=1353138 RepID=UPI00351C6003
MPTSNRAAIELAPLLDGSSAGELIPELVRHGLQQLIELEVAAVLGAERHERSEERLGYRNGYLPDVNYVGGSRQLRRRVTPGPPPAMAGGGDSEK